MRVRGDKLRFKIERGGGWNAINVEGSSDLKSWTMLYDETLRGPYEKEIEVDIRGYDFIRFRLTDGDQSFEWLRLSKRMVVEGMRPLPLCEWLPSTITSMDIAALVLAANDIRDLGFVVLRKDIEGVAEYYKGNLSDGDRLTGCSLAGHAGFLRLWRILMRTRRRA